MEEKFKEIELLLRGICFRVKVAGRFVLKEFDLSTSQFDILQYLYFEGPKKMSELSKKMGVTKSTMTGLVSRMENADYVQKVPFEKDRRVILVKISLKGESIIKKVIDERVKFVANSLKNIDRSELLENLQKVNSAISKEFDQLKKR